MAAANQVVANITAIGSITPWLKHNYHERPFDLSLLVSFGSGLSATLALDYILDDMSNAAQRQVSISQTTTTITVTDPGPILPPPMNGLGHGLAVGDAVELTGTPGGVSDGIYAVATVTNATTYTLTAVSATIAQQPAYVVSGRILTAAASGGADNIVKVAPVTARTSLVLASPIWASRLRCTAFTSSGVAALVALQGDR